MSNPEASKGGEFYPMASGKPFTPIAKGRSGDPYYHPEALTQLHSLKEGIHISLNELSKQALADPAAMKKGVNYLNHIFYFLLTALIVYTTSKTVEDHLSYETHPLASLPSALAAMMLIGGILASDDPNRVEIVARKLSLRELQRLPDTPNNPCEMKLTDNVFKACLGGEELPNELIDPLTQDIIEDPVMFLDDDDATMTVFDRSSAEQLLEAGMVHPVTRRKIVRSELVELPELKSQIERLKNIQEKKLS